MIREYPGICFIDHLPGKRDMYPVVTYKIGKLGHEELDQLVALAALSITSLSFCVADIMRRASHPEHDGIKSHRPLVVLPLLRVDEGCIRHKLVVVWCVKGI
ncbi:hypothetical protein CUC08_Gglean004602 [Alternaria sp. MG1]|nr:hypothetical protein CUC08_Gglean004602 [Alternaria sp. MG1]